MARVISTYEAKAKFGELIRRVRAGERIVISYRGEEVAELRPIRPDEDSSLETVLRRLEEDGILSPEVTPAGPLAPVARRPGALARFLKSRE